MKLGRSETEGESSQDWRCAKWSGLREKGREKYNKKRGEVIKKGREEEERKKGENEERRVYLNPEGCGLSCFEEEFRRI